MAQAGVQFRVRTKVCGITSSADADMAVAAGADAIGLVFYAGSKRCVEVEQARRICAALPPFVTRVGLFVNESGTDIQKIVSTCGLDVAQLHGDEEPEACSIPGVRVIKALRLRENSDVSICDAYAAAGVEGFLLDAWVEDAYGGTGICAPWEIAARFARIHRVILAGGLTPDNVAAAIERVRPYAVDVSSGVEQSAGIKDEIKVRAFVANAMLA